MSRPDVPQVGESRRNKFGAKKTTVDGITFDSKREAGHWSELRLLEKAGRVRNLRRQVRYPLAVNGREVCVYVADFVFEEPAKEFRYTSAAPGETRLTGGGFFDTDDWKEVVADSKGYKTPEYRLKKKLVLACLGVEIREL